MGNHVETLRWNGSAIEMIDQRILPHRIEYIACDSAQSVAKAIRDMVVRGAPAIGVAAAYGVALEAILRKNEASNVFSTSLEEGFKVWRQSHRLPVNLFWALDRMRKLWETHQAKNQPELADIFLGTAHEILEEDIRINRAMGEYGASLLPDGSRVLTHCNAGALATAGPWHRSRRFPFRCRSGQAHFRFRR